MEKKAELHCHGCHVSSCFQMSIGVSQCEPFKLLHKTWVSQNNKKTLRTIS